MEQLTPAGAERLDSWKEIAEHIGRDVRTAMRWEKERRLPVHRVPGGRRHAVFAYTRELDIWLKQQQTTAGMSSEDASSARPLRRVHATMLLLLAGVSLLALLWRSSAGEAQPERVHRLDFSDQRHLTFSQREIAVPGSGWLAGGDLNGDGKADIVVGGHARRALFILMGRGDGTFSAPLVVELDFVPVGIVVTDLERDGNLDVVFGSDDRPVAGILRGRQDGGFSPLETISPDFEARARAAADFESDGYPDLVLLHAARAGFTVLPNRGGKLGTPQEYLNSATASFSSGSDIAIGDMNNDGRPDVLTTSTLPDGENYALLLLCRADGSFAPPRRLQAVSGMARLLPADFNADGALDLAIYGSGERLSVLLGNGDGTFQARHGTRKPQGFASVYALDLDSDGHRDIVAATPTNSEIVIFLGNGDGTFSPPRTIPLRSYTATAAVDDYDGNGLPDLVVQGTEKVLFMLLQQAD